MPTSGGIAQARQRLGPEPMAGLFTQVAVPVATMETAGAFLGRWRLTSIGGMAWDIPEQAGERGRVRLPEGGEGRVAGRVPQGPGGHGQRVRVARGGAGRDRPLRAQGRRRARAGPPGSTPSWRRTGCSIADRGFYDWPDWCTAAGTGAALLWRFKSDIRLPVLEILPDGSYRSVLVTPKARAAARQELVEAARAGADLDPGRARHVRVVEYEIPDRDGEDELIALVTTITDPLEAPAAVAAAYHEDRRIETPSQLTTFLRGPGRVLRVAIPEHDRAGDLGLPPGPLRDQRPDLHRRDQRGHRPGQGEVQENSIRAVRRRVADPAFSP